MKKSTLNSSTTEANFLVLIPTWSPIAVSELENSFFLLILSVEEEEGIFDWKLPAVMTFPHCRKLFYYHLVPIILNVQTISSLHLSSLNFQPHNNFTFSLLKI